MIQELKKGTAELLVLCLLEDGARHGYDIAKLIGASSEGQINFHAASLYPLLYRLEQSNRIRGRWVEKPGQRRRRYYELTSAGRKALAEQRTGWRSFVKAMNRIVGESHA